MLPSDKGIDCMNFPLKYSSHLPACQPLKSKHIKARKLLLTKFWGEKNVRDFFQNLSKRITHMNLKFLYPSAASSFSYKKKIPSPDFIKCLKVKHPIVICLGDQGRLWEPASLTSSHAAAVHSNCTYKTQLVLGSRECCLVHRDAACGTRPGLLLLLLLLND